MAGIFDKLQGKLEARKAEGGITPLDLIDLPSDLRLIMRMMLRKVTMTYPEICAGVDKMPPNRQINKDVLKESLETLAEQGWLIKLGAGELITYRVNLRRKSGSKLGVGVWGNLNSKIVGIDAQNISSDEDETNAPESASTADESTSE